MRKLAFLPLVVLLAACGAKQVGTVTHPWTTNPKDTPQKGPCAGIPNPTEVITLTFAGGVPKDLGVRFPTDGTNYHLNECHAAPQTGVLVSLARPAANTLVVSIDTNGAYTDASGVTTLPASTSIELVDMHSCDGSAPTSVYKPSNPVPILWTSSYPLGNGCPAKLIGSYTGSASRSEEAPELVDADYAR